MPTNSLTLLKATRIAEAQNRVETATQEMDTATAQLSAARQSLAASQSEEQRDTLELNVKNAQEQVESARQRLEYESSNLQRLVDARPKDSWMAVTQYAVFGILSAIVLVFMMIGIISDKMLPTLANVATARGLITFLITIVTVTIALILLLSTIVSNSPDRNQRYLDGKDLLFALIGVLGTIVGFYFGQTTTGVESLRMAPVFLSTENPTEGDAVNLVTFVHGGTAPYTYSVSFGPANLVEGVTDANSEKGQISISFKAPKVEKETQLTFAINVTDAKGHMMSYDSKTVGKNIQLKPSSN